jgi:hypothetical protein
LILIKRTKRRSIPAKGSHIGYLEQNTVRNLPPPAFSTRTESKSELNLLQWRGTETLVSENHPAWRHLKEGDFQGDVGGEFYLYKRYCPTPIGQARASGRRTPVKTVPENYDLHRYHGFILPLSPGSLTWPTPTTPSSNSVLDAWGSKAIAACKPTNPAVDTGVLLGEILTGGLPSFTIKALKHMRYTTQSLLKVSAEALLKHQFEWSPIVRDAVTIMNTVMSFDERVQQLERDSGKVVRRRFEFPLVETLDEQSVGSGLDPYFAPSSAVLRRTDSNGNTVSPKGQVTRIEQTLVRRWFSGAFTYYVPKDYSSDDSLGGVTRAVQDVYGLAITPDLLWNLAPWSWAVDWFSSAGAVASNISDAARFGLVLRYGYVMEHTLRQRIWTYSGRSSLYSSAVPSPFILVDETKVRRKATPFGFGLTWDGLSPLQVAIAAALGITRS